MFGYDKWIKSQCKLVLIQVPRASPDFVLCPVPSFYFNSTHGKYSTRLSTLADLHSYLIILFPIILLILSCIIYVL